MITITYKGKTYKWKVDNFDGATWGVCKGIDEVRLTDDDTVYIHTERGIVYTDHTPEQLVKLGYLEEVKENKEEYPKNYDVYDNSKGEYVKLNIEENKEGKGDGMSQLLKLEMENRMENVSNAIKYAKEHSILKKLREELERREKEHRDCENELSEFSLGVWQAECEILALLTSLEQPKEETSKSNIPSREELDKMAIPEWTPTPGQMIEVSNDREKWEDRPRKFVCLVGSDHFRAFGPTI